MSVFPVLDERTSEFDGCTCVLVLVLGGKRNTIGGCVRTSIRVSISSSPRLNIITASEKYYRGYVLAASQPRTNAAPRPYIKNHSRERKLTEKNHSPLNHNPTVLASKLRGERLMNR